MNYFNLLPLKCFCSEAISTSLYYRGYIYTLCSGVVGVEVKASD